MCKNSKSNPHFYIGFHYMTMSSFYMTLLIYIMYLTFLTIRFSGLKCYVLIINGKICYLTYECCYLSPVYTINIRALIRSRRIARKKFKSL